MAAITDQLTQATTTSRPVPTTVSSIRAGGGATLSCLALTGWPTATAVHFITYKVTTAGVKINGSQCDWKGIVSGTTITGLVLKAGTDSGNAIGDVVEASPTAAWANDVVAWGTAHANQDGSLIPAVVRTALGQGAATGAGWTTLGQTPTTVTANGNRSYTAVFNGVDITGTISAGQRLMTQRTVAAPIQCTNLNGTSQFWNNVGPAGMTFTNNFVVSAWVKLSSYASGAIASRYNGTSGWVLKTETSGQVTIAGFNAGSSNVSYGISAQSLPLNKWVHVAGQLDMATFTATPTTTYIMIDGVDVPVTVNRGGTNPTALIQAGNLEIGSQNAGLLPFPGKIAQVAIYSAKVTEATILASMHQTLVGTETSLISAYSFNGNGNDLAATANNLTSQGAAPATNGDSPYGTQASGLISSTLDYGIVQKAVFSTNTTVNIQVPEGCTLPTSGGIAVVSYSPHKSPYGFPAQRGKWRVETLIGVQDLISPGSITSFNNWFTFNSKINVPVGEWTLGYSYYYEVNGSTPASIYGRTTLGVSTAAPDSELVSRIAPSSNTSAYAGLTLTRERSVSLASATTYSPLALVEAGAGNIGATLGFTVAGTTPVGLSVIRAETSLL